MKKRSDPGSSVTEGLVTEGVNLNDISILSAKAIKDPCILIKLRRSNKRDVEVVYEEAL